MPHEESGACVPLLHFLEDRRHCGKVVVHVEHRVTVMDRCRTHQEVDGSSGAVLRPQGELVLRGVAQNPRSRPHKARLEVRGLTFAASPGSVRCTENAPEKRVSPGQNVSAWGCWVGRVGLEPTADGL